MGHAHARRQHECGGGRARVLPALSLSLARACRAHAPMVSPDSTSRALVCPSSDLMKICISWQAAGRVGQEEECHGRGALTYRSDVLHLLLSWSTWQAAEKGGATVTRHRQEGKF